MSEQTISHGGACNDGLPIHNGEDAYECHGECRQDSCRHLNTSISPTREGEADWFCLDCEAEGRWTREQMERLVAEVKHWTGPDPIPSPLSDTCPAVDTDPAGSACRPAMPYAEPKEQP